MRRATIANAAKVILPLQSTTLKSLLGKYTFSDLADISWEVEQNPVYKDAIWSIWVVHY